VLRRTTPLEQSADVGHAESLATGTLSLSLVRDHAWLLLQGDPDDSSLRTALLRCVGLLLPQQNRALTVGARSILWLAPREWLLEVPGREEAGLEAALTGDFAQTANGLTVLSDALAGFDISGIDAPDLLSTGCSLDLDQGAFDTGSVSRTLLADVPVILWRRSANQGFRCLVDRALSHHLWSWLADWGNIER
jgi:heterotetrameric sarcosine oxidase gamma subunit